MVQSQYEQIKPGISHLLQSETKTLKTTEKVRDYCRTVDKFLNKIDSKNSTEKLNEDRFTKLLDSSIDLNKIEKDLCNGHLPSELAISKIELLKTLLSSQNIFTKNNPKNKVRDKLNKISNLVKNYNLLSNIEKQLFIPGYDFLNSTQNRLVTLINLIETVQQDYQRATASQLIYQNPHINDICNALNEIQQSDTFKNYYPAFFQSIEASNLFLRQIRIWTKYKIEFADHQVFFKIDQILQNSSLFFQNLVVEDIMYAMYLTNLLPVNNEQTIIIFNAAVFTIWEKCYGILPNDKENPFFILGKSEEKQLFLDRISEYCTIDNLVFTDLIIDHEPIPDR
jgi:hypothetical protein